MFMTFTIITTVVTQVRLEILPKLTSHQGSPQVNSYFKNLIFSGICPNFCRGGQVKDINQIVINYFVQIQGGQVGQKPNLPDVIKYAVFFFFEGSPKDLKPKIAGN